MPRNTHLLNDGALERQPSAGRNSNYALNRQFIEIECLLRKKGPVSPRINSQGHERREPPAKPESHLGGTDRRQGAGETPRLASGECREGQLHQNCRVLLSWLSVKWRSDVLR
jgi:hypothetical protein